MTAAHPILPMVTKANVTNLQNRNVVEVTINDRGPFAKGRVIDLPRGAAHKLDMENDGTAQVKIEPKPVKN
jgi:rare lipoprotein A